jgi:hypothetical protein
VIEIEQHAFIEQGDEEDLFELTHLTTEDLDELVHHLNVSGARMSTRFTSLHVRLNKLISSLDTAHAS